MIKEYFFKYVEWVKKSWGADTSKEIAIAMTAITAGILVFFTVILLVLIFLFTNAAIIFWVLVGFVIFFFGVWAYLENQENKR